MRRLSAVQEVLEVETPLQTIDQVRKLFKIMIKTFMQREKSQNRENKKNHKKL